MYCGARSKDKDAENSEDSNTELQIHVLRCELELAKLAKEAAEKELAKLRSSLGHIFDTSVVKHHRKFVSREAVHLLSFHTKLFTREQSGLDQADIEIVLKMDFTGLFFVYRWHC